METYIRLHRRSPALAISISWWPMTASAHGRSFQCSVFKEISNNALSTAEFQSTSNFARSSMEREVHGSAPQPMQMTRATQCDHPGGQLLVQGPVCLCRHNSPHCFSSPLIVGTKYDVRSGHLRDSDSPRTKKLARLKIQR